MQDDTLSEYDFVGGYHVTLPTSMPMTGTRISLAIFSLVATAIGAFFLTALVMLSTGDFAPHDYILVLENTFPDREFFLVSHRGVERVPLETGRPIEIQGNDGRRGINRLAYLLAAPKGRILEEIKSGAVTFPDLYNSAEGDSLPTEITRSQRLDFHDHVNFYDSRNRVIERWLVDVNADGSLSMTLQEVNCSSLTRKLAWAVVILCFLAACWWMLFWICCSTWALIRG